LPPKVDLRTKCPPLYDQGQLGSCTANAIAGAIEFDQMKEQLPQVFVPSRLFIYYNERVIEGTVDSDSGAMLRDGIKTVAKQGACPEPMWPYAIAKFKTKPSTACYTEAAKHTAVSYQRLVQSLTQMQGCLASGYPFVFGFTVYESFESNVVAHTGHAPMPGVRRTCPRRPRRLRRRLRHDPALVPLPKQLGNKMGNARLLHHPLCLSHDSDLSADFWTIRVVQ
jgi:C1A family cysteine protease